MPRSNINAWNIKSLLCKNESKNWCLPCFLKQHKMNKDIWQMLGQNTASWRSTTIEQYLVWTTKKRGISPFALRSNTVHSVLHKSKSFCPHFTTDRLHSVVLPSDLNKAAWRNKTWTNNTSKLHIASVDYVAIRPQKHNPVSFRYSLARALIFLVLISYVYKSVQMTYVLLKKQFQMGQKYRLVIIIYRKTQAQCYHSCLRLQRVCCSLFNKLQVMPNVPFYAQSIITESLETQK